MFKSIVSDLVDPNTGDADFEVHGVRVLRDSRVMRNICDRDIRDDDDIIDGVLKNVATNRTFPILKGVASLLIDQDVDLGLWGEGFMSFRTDLPIDLKSAVDKRLEELSAILATPTGEWNRGEMDYYDAQVVTDDQKADMAREIQETVLDRIFFPRERIILRHLKERIAGCKVVEVGCGNARTISRIMNPHEFNFSYVGTDISFHRLVVARETLQAANLIQASAMNLPLKTGCADAVLAFGALHHMPSVERALDEGDRILKSRGFFGFHEPIGTPKLIERRFVKISKWLQTYQHSEHDGDIDLRNVMAQLGEKKFTQVKRMFCISPFRTAAEHVLRTVVNERVIQNRLVSRILYAVDSIPCTFFRATLPALGPRAITLLCQKPVHK